MRKRYEARIESYQLSLHSSVLLLTANAGYRRQGEKIFQLS